MQAHRQDLLVAVVEAGRMIAGVHYGRGPHEVTGSMFRGLIDTLSALDAAPRVTVEDVAEGMTDWWDSHDGFRASGLARAAMKRLGVSDE